MPIAASLGMANRDEGHSSGPPSAFVRIVSPGVSYEWCDLKGDSRVDRHHAGIRLDEEDVFAAIDGSAHKGVFVHEDDDTEGRAHSSSTAHEKRWH